MFLNETRLGCGKNTFRLESRGLALTEAARGGRGEFFKIGLMPKGSEYAYGCCAGPGEGLSCCGGRGDSVLDTGEGLMLRSHVLAKVFAVVGVYIVCVVLGARPLVKEPYVLVNEVVCSESLGRLLADWLAALVGVCDRLEGTECP